MDKDDRLLETEEPSEQNENIQEELPKDGENSSPGEKETPKKKGKFRAWWQAHKPTRRRIVQVYVALLTNANIKGFFSGKIYKGATKYVCTPGLNCYSCPGAVGACPLGSLQNAFASSNIKTPLFMLGIILLYGLLFARTVCGWLCPVGLGQELLYKIPTPKVKKSRFTRVLSYLKYVILIVFVVAIPLLLAGTPTPAFCKFICPAGTIGGAIPLLLNPTNANMLDGLGGLFTWKFIVLVVLAVGSIFIFRFFCRFFCPLGALYGFFNKIALLGVKLDETKCTDCGLCVSHCKMDIRKVGDHECINCGECIDVCPAKAISWKGSKLFLHKNAVEVSAPVTEQAIDLKEGVVLAAAATANAEAKNSDPIPAISVQNPETGTKKKGKGKAFWIRLAAWCTAGAVLVGALVYYNFIHKESKPALPPLQVGDVCYDFTLEGYNGESFTLSQHRGKIVVINFWGTWCGPCVAELPAFEEIRSEFSDKVELVAVHSFNLAETAVPFLEKNGWTAWGAIFLQDTSDTSNNDVNVLLGGGGEAYPYTVIVDEEGVVAFTRLNELGGEILRAEIEKLLK